MIFEPMTIAAARDALARMAGNPKWDTSGGLASIAGIIGAGSAYTVMDDAGRALMIVIVQRVEHAMGIELVVRVALELVSDGDLTERLLPHIECAFGHDCAAVTIYTKRPGLVRKLETIGYTEAAKIMRKNMKK